MKMIAQGIYASARAPLARSVLSGLAFASLAPLAIAAEGDDITLPSVTVSEEAEPSYRSESVGLAKLPMATRDIPQSISVIPQQLMEDQGATTLRDALRNVSGLSFSAGEGGASGDNINLRGFSARNDMFIDGVRDSGQYTRDSFNIESVEVLKGPSSMLLGRGTTGGAVNQTSKQPGLVDKASVGLTVGTDDLWRATADVNQKLSDTVAIRLNTVGHTAGSTRDEVETNRWAIAPSISFGLGTPTEVTLSHLHQEEDNIPDYGVPYLFGRPAPVDSSTFYGLATDDHEDLITDVTTLSVKHRFSDHLSLRNTLRYGHYERDITPTAPRIAGSPTTSTALEQISVTRSRPAREGVDTILSNQLDLTSVFNTGDYKHTLVTGFELARETTDLDRYTLSGVPTASLVAPNADPNLSGMSSKLASSTETTADTVAFYALDEIALNPQWKVVGGLRWEQYEADYTESVAGLNFAHTDRMLSGRLGVVWQPDSQQSYYIAYGNSFNPSAETLSLSKANQALDPEENRNLELGAKWDLLDGDLSLRSAVFSLEKTNARTTDPADTTVQVLDGEQRVNGIELEVAGRLTENWDLFAGYAYMESEIVKSNDVQSGVAVQGNEIANTPRHSGSVWTSYDLGQGWEVGGGVYAMSKRYANNANTNQVPGYARWDATLAYQQKDYDIRLNAFNLTDKEYYESVYSGQTVPASGRAFSLSFDYRF